MTHRRIHRLAITILGIASALALALAATYAPASARTFSFNSVGSMIQQPLPPQWGYMTVRVLATDVYKFHRPHSAVH